MIVSGKKFLVMQPLVKVAILLVNTIKFPLQESA